ncbi:MAG: tetratricopeptide repeat protein [Deltaproteobacteria bacterium]|nr:tetratricopeptide repeat protein [Deltaproteobacteria bacterium]
MRKFSFYVLVFLTIIFIAPSSIALGQTDSDDMIRQFSFADRLFEEKDFFRAITEYKRFIFFYPEAYDMCEIAYYKIGMGYHRAKRYEESIVAFMFFLEKYPESSRRNDVLYHKGIAEKFLQQLDEALSTFQTIINSDHGEYRDKAIFQRALIFVDCGDWGRARESFLQIPKESTNYPSASVFVQGLENIHNIPQKSPTVAGSLAALIPGAGHLYTERPRDALVAFLLNSVFILAAVELFNDEQYIAGGIVTFFELGWYSGNIYSAVSSAHKYNKRAEDDFISGLRERGSMSLLYDRYGSDTYLAFNLRF